MTEEERIDRMLGVAADLRELADTIEANVERRGHIDIRGEINADYDWQPKPAVDRGRTPTPKMLVGSLTRLNLTVDIRWPGGKP